MKKILILFLIMVLVACQNGEFDNEEEIQEEIEESVEESIEEIQEEIHSVEEITETDELDESEAVSIDGYETIDLFEQYLIPDHSYEIICLGRLTDQIYFAIEDIKLTEQNSKTTYELYKVSYDYKNIRPMGSIDCDYLARDNQAIFMTIPEREHDIEEIIVYGQETVYLYSLTGRLNHSYNVFGEGDAPWNNSLEVVGDLVDWYVYPGMSVIIYQDEEGVKFFNGMTEVSSILDIEVEDSISWFKTLQTYLDNVFGTNLIKVDANPFSVENLSEEVRTSTEFEKILYEDINGELLLMRDSKGKIYFIRSNQNDEHVELKTLEVEVSMYTQREEANMIIPTTSLLAKPHWSDDLMISLLDIYDPILEKKIVAMFPSATVIPNNKDITFIVSVGDINRFELDRDSFESIGYLMEEDIRVDFSGKNLNYHMTRWNEDRSDTLLYTKEIEDDYFIVELDFEYETINQELIEETIVTNINYYRESEVKPDLEFQWIEDKKLIVTVTNMIEELDYAISLNGYITEDGTCHYTWSTCHGYIGYLEEYHEGYYDFTKVKSNNAKCIEYSITSQEVKEIGVIKHYNYSIGPSDGNFVGVALPVEWGYSTYIYDMKTNTIYDHGQYCGYYHDYFEYEDELYFLDSRKVSKVKSDGDLMTVFELEDEKASIYTVRKHPTEDMFIVVFDRDYKETAIITLDEDFNVLYEVDIDFNRLGFYGILMEPYWLDEDTIILTGGTDDEFNQDIFYTTHYNIKTGEIENRIDDEKIMTISEHGEFVLTQKVNNGQVIKVYNEAMELIHEVNLKSSSVNPSYQYMDYWYDNILYLKYYDTDEIYKWNLETNEITTLELPYENYIIDKVLEEDVFRLFINIKMIRRSNPYWS